MIDFMIVARTGPDFVNIVFEQVSEDIDNILVELFVDEMKMRTFVCDGTDSSLTIQPLAEGDYEYKVSQISDKGVYVAEGIFTIGKKESFASEGSNIDAILEHYAQILFTKGGNIFSNGQYIMVPKGTSITVEDESLVFRSGNYGNQYIVPFNGIQYISLY